MNLNRLLIVWGIFMALSIWINESIDAPLIVCAFIGFLLGCASFPVARLFSNGQSTHPAEAIENQIEFFGSDGFMWMTFSVFVASFAYLILH